MRKWFIRLVITAAMLSLGWMLLSFWANAKGRAAEWTIGEPGAAKHALIIFDPDPFYNFDEQVCKAFAKGLAQHGFSSRICTVAKAEPLYAPTYDLYVFCANTYNGHPDAAVSYYIQQQIGLQDQKTVSITLGGGYTERSQEMFNRLLSYKNVHLIESFRYWLWRPNDENRSKERNVAVAVSMAEAAGAAVAKKFPK